MPNAIFNFLKDQDQLGAGVSLNYRSNASFGTILGGVLSVITTLFFTAFTGLCIYTWAFLPQFNQTFTQSYLQRKSDTISRSRCKYFCQRSAFIALLRMAMCLSTIRPISHFTGQSTQTIPQLKPFLSAALI